MFQNPHYLTKGISCTLPPDTILLLWKMVSEVPDPKDYLQTFPLISELGQQRVEHNQVQPPYKKIIYFASSETADTTIYVINDGDYNTMLLAEEY